MVVGEHREEFSVHAPRRLAPGELLLGIGQAEADFADERQNFVGISERLRRRGTEVDLRGIADFEFCSLKNGRIDLDPEILRARHDRAVESDAVHAADDAKSVAAGTDSRRLDRPAFGWIKWNFECGPFVAVEQRGGKSRVFHFVILPAAASRYSRPAVHPILQELPMRMRALLLFIVVLSAFPLLAVDIHDTRLLSEPAVS